MFYLLLIKDICNFLTKFEIYLKVHILVFELAVSSRVLLVVLRFWSRSPIEDQKELHVLGCSTLCYCFIFDVRDMFLDLSISS